MSSYHCYDEQENYRINRFPDGTIGLAEWWRLIERSRGQRTITKIGFLFVADDGKIRRHYDEEQLNHLTECAAAAIR